MQKNVLLPLLFFLITFSAQAQLAAGNLLLGGSGQFGISTSTQNHGEEITYQNTSFGLSPQVGYFLSDRVAAGLSFGFNSYRQRSQGSQSIFQNHNNHFSIGPFVRAYQMVSEKAGFFGQVSGTYGVGRYRNRRESTTWEERQTASSLGAYFQPGFTYFIHQNLGAEFTFGSIGYSKNQNNMLAQNEKRTAKGLRADLGLGTFGVSFNYYINR
jgi:hypothetical protein